MPDDFKVKVGEIEGPLELILDLIEKRKLHISDISLSQVADEFIEHIKSFEEFPMSDSADFILVASTLLLIKSKSLLPNLQLTEEEQGSIEDLENRLAVYKKYKELATGLQKMFGNFLYFAEPARLASESIAGGEKMFYPTSDITPISLKNALQEVIKNMPQKIEELPKVVVDKIISLEDMVEKLTERIKTSLRTSFSDFAGVGKAEKVNVIVSFLAMLELVKQGAVRVSQNKHFDDIQIESENTNVPTYY
ncbi:MAG: ScpA family protein [Candidatus Zambryskibacteria bacterium]